MHLIISAKSPFRGGHDVCLYVCFWLRHWIVTRMGVTFSCLLAYSCLPYDLSDYTSLHISSPPLGHQYRPISLPLQRRHNEHDGVSDHQPHDCFLKRLFRQKNQRKHQSSASLAFMWGIHRSTGEFPAQSASNAENVPIWWRHHESAILWTISFGPGLYCHGLLLRPRPSVNRDVVSSHLSSWLVNHRLFLVKPSDQCLAGCFLKI